MIYCSSGGNRTSVSLGKGGDTDHYTTEESSDVHKKYFFNFNGSLSLAEKKLFLAPGEDRTPSFSVTVGDSHH